MRTLKSILNQKLNESLDDNIFWMINKWFENNDEQRIEFNNIVNKFINSTFIDKNQLIEELKYTEFNNYLVQFVNFVDNIIAYNEDIDYIERFIQILKQVIYKQKIKGAY